MSALVRSSASFTIFICAPISTDHPTARRSDGGRINLSFTDRWYVTIEWATSKHHHAPRFIIKCLFELVVSKIRPQRTLWSRASLSCLSCSVRFGFNRSKRNHLVHGTAPDGTPAGHAMRCSPVSACPTRLRTARQSPRGQSPGPRRTRPNARVQWTSNKCAPELHTSRSPAHHCSVCCVCM